MAVRNLDWMLPVRAVEAVFAIIVLGLIAYVINWEDNTFGDSADSVNFMLFNSVWTLLIALPYLSLVPLFFAQFSHIYGILGVEIVTMIFWFAGFIALAAELPPSHACNISPCRSATAATVFGAFEWLLFAITTAFAVRVLLRPANGTTAKPGAQVAAHPGV